MDTDSERIQRLVQQPQESLSVELKAWIDPDKPEGIAKIVKTVIAIRNHGGGYMVIGFDDKTLEPISDNPPTDVKTVFHIDKIQGMITKYSSEPFEIAIDFPVRDEQEFPVITIPTEIKTPVVTKSDLLNPESTPRFLIRADTVYVRSLTANNTPSTTQAKWKDFPVLTEVCFDNREADIGRFFRRHLNDLNQEQLKILAAKISQNSKSNKPVEDKLNNYFQKCEVRYQSLLSDRDEELPEHGTWQVGLILDGDVPTHSANRDFLNLLNSSNPDYTGWPIWIDTKNFPKEEDRPHVINGVWETLIISLGDNWAHLVEFMQFDPKGNFFLRRGLEDDISNSERSPQPLTALDFGLTILRTAEAIAVGMAFAKAMKCVPEETSLAFAFKWTKLRERKLSAWASPNRFIRPIHTAYQDEIVTYTNVPLDVSLSALSQYVNQVVEPVFATFDGATINLKIVEDITRDLIERRN